MGRPCACCAFPPRAARGPLTLGLYSLTGVEGSGSLRVYAGTGPGAALAAASTQDGLLDARVWPAGPDRAARVFAVWSGPPAAHGVRALHAELWAGAIASGWSARGPPPPSGPTGCGSAGWRTRRRARVRYELRYPGWEPGCDGQTEQEDLYRLDRGGRSRAGARQVANGWHRELGAAVGPPRSARWPPGRRRRWARWCPRPGARARGCRAPRPRAGLRRRPGRRTARRR